MRKPSDRERIARNWHKILGELKSQFGLKNKAEIYKVLQRLPIPMKAPRHSDLMAPWVPT